MANKNMMNTKNTNVKATADVEVREDFMEKAEINPKKIYSWKDETVVRHTKIALQDREKALKYVDKLHVKLQNGNKKTGKKKEDGVFTVSLYPIIDCQNCDKCKNNCYDNKHDVIKDSCYKDRIKNSAIHKANPERFWNEVDMGIKLRAGEINMLRINVGGDLTYEDFGYVNNLAAMNPDVTFQFFTKNYNGINKWLDENYEFESNIQAIISVWKDMPYSNPHNLPTSHVLWADGTTTAPEYGAYFCKGNCATCLRMKDGCFRLKKGECVVFSAH